MRYSIEHETIFEYSAPVRESVMEVRAQPRHEAGQRLLGFTLRTEPEAWIHDYVDADGNTIHYFDVPGEHQELAIIAGTDVEVDPLAKEETAVEKDAWRHLDALRGKAPWWPWLAPSPLASPSGPVDALRDELALRDAEDPLSALRLLNDRLNQVIRYSPGATRVDSTIEDCLAARRGVCQDFAHVFIALARGLGIPCRYVSGHLFHRDDSCGAAGDGATHAWVEAFVPGPGWVGFDPANGSPTGDRHIRVAIGRDYSDVPPTRGVFRGQAEAHLRVRVSVTKPDAPKPSQPVVASREPEPRAAAARPDDSDMIVLSHRGPLGLTEAAAFDKSACEIIPHAGRRLVLDLSAATLLTSAGIGSLLKLQGRWKRAGGMFLLAAVPEKVIKVLRLSKLDQVFTIVDRVEDARDRR